MSPFRSVLQKLKIEIASSDMPHYERITHGFGKENILACISLLDNILENSRHCLSFPHPALMRNCVCGSRKFITSKDSMIVCQFIGNGSEHDIPVLVDDAVSFADSAKWRPFILEN